MPRWRQTNNFGLKTACARMRTMATTGKTSIWTFLSACRGPAAACAGRRMRRRHALGASSARTTAPSRLGSRTAPRHSSRGARTAPTAGVDLRHHGQLHQAARLHRRTPRRHACGKSLMNVDESDRLARRSRRGRSSEPRAGSCAPRRGAPRTPLPRCAPPSCTLPRFRPLARNVAASWRQ